MLIIFIFHIITHYRSIDTLLADFVVSFLHFGIEGK